MDWQGTEPNSSLQLLNKLKNITLNIEAHNKAQDVIYSEQEINYFLHTGNKSFYFHPLFGYNTGSTYLFILFLKKKQSH